MGASTTTGNNNTALGSNRGPARSNSGNSMALSYSATVSASSAMRPGAAITLSLYYKVGVPVTSNARFKHGVQASVPGRACITRLRPVTSKAS